MAKQKDLSIETLRGLAILLVVAGYIISDDLGRFGHSFISSALKFAYYCLKPIRMPLFTVISAYLYAASPAVRETFQKLVTGKVRRILIPFMVVSAMQYMFYALVPGKEAHPLHELYKIYLFPLEQFWFLYSIFWIFVLVGIMDSVKLLETPRKWVAWLAVAMVAHVVFQPTRLFSIAGVNYLFPFFLIGYGIRRFSTQFFKPVMISFYFATTLFAYLFYLYLYIKPIPNDTHHIYIIIGLLISSTAVPLIFYYRRSVPFLAKIGCYAFGIHIFNKISIVLPRLLFQQHHVQDDGLIFVTYLVCGIIFSIGLQILFEKFNFTRKFVLGLKEENKEKPKKYPQWSFSRPKIGPALAGVCMVLFFSLSLSFAATHHGGALMSRSSELLCQATGMCANASHKCMLKCGHCTGARHLTITK